MLHGILEFCFWLLGKRNNQFLLDVAILYKVSTNNEVQNSEPMLPEKIQGLVLRYLYNYFHETLMS